MDGPAEAETPRRDTTCKLRLCAYPRRRCLDVGDQRIRMRLVSRRASLRVTRLVMVGFKRGIGAVKDRGRDREIAGRRDEVGQRTHVRVDSEDFLNDDHARSTFTVRAGDVGGHREIADGDGDVFGAHGCQGPFPAPVPPASRSTRYIRLAREATRLSAVTMNEPPAGRM